MSRWKIIRGAVVMVMGVVLAARAQPPVGVESWRDAGAEFDRRVLSPRGEQALRFDPSIRHAETDHFVVHYEQAIFAHKVARMAEFFYRYISEDLRGPADRLEGRSHLVIFRTPARWSAFLSANPDLPSWSASLVEGAMMYLQQTEDTRSGGDRLAHEMTHLVMNRFFAGRPPLWLQEGIAEFYGEFAWSSFKGIKKSQRAAFRPLPKPYPLEQLLAATAYPPDPADVSRFYTTSRYLVGFLRLAHPAEKFPAFVGEIHRETDAQAVLARHYGYATTADLEKAFLKFAR